MASFLKDALDYLAGQVANLTKEDDTAGGNTDDKNQGKPTQKELIGAGSTDAKTAANELFTSGVRIPALLIAAGDTYDLTQSFTRMNKLYGFTRSNFYTQASSNVETRKNRLAFKQKLVSECVKLSEEPKKMQEIEQA
jgi:hypothetical protein